LPINSDCLKRLGAWLFGEYCEKLTNNNCALDANKLQNEDSDDVGIGHNKNNDNDDDDDADGNGNGNIVSNNILFKPFSVKDIIDKLKLLLENDKSSTSVRGYCLTALMKVLHKFGDDYEDKIREIIDKYENNVIIELQQRSIEYQSLFENTSDKIRKEVLLSMPVIKRKINDDDMDNKTDPSDVDTDTDSTDIGSDNGGSDNSDANNDTEDSSDDDRDNKKKKKRYYIYIITYKHHLFYQQIHINQLI